MSNICAVCQFCTYEDGRPPETYCHNEHSQNQCKYGGYSFVPNMDKYGYPYNPMEIEDETFKLTGR